MGRLAVALTCLRALANIAASMESVPVIGQTFCHYRIVERIGAGGMGEVYRARDSKLNRHVALKVLPEVFARDAERMARFAGTGLAEPSQHRHDLRLRGVQWELRAGDGTGRGTDVGGAAGKNEKRKSARVSIFEFRV